MTHYIVITSITYYWIATFESWQGSYFIVCHGSSMGSLKPENTLHKVKLINWKFMPANFGQKYEMKIIWLKCFWGNRFKSTNFQNGWQGNKKKTKRNITVPEKASEFSLGKTHSISQSERLLSKWRVRWRQRPVRVAYFIGDLRKEFQGLCRVLQPKPLYYARKRTKPWSDFDAETYARLFWCTRCGVSALTSQTSFSNPVCVVVGRFIFCQLFFCKGVIVLGSSRQFTNSEIN